jgi:hypothetical protein
MGSKSSLEGCRNAEFLKESSVSGPADRLTPARMTAAGIRPQFAGVILGWMTLLKKNPPATVNQKDREGSMKKAPLVHCALAERGQDSIHPIDQD